MAHTTHLTIVVMLHNVRSALNVGSIFRTAESAGVREVILSGYTPLPIDRFGRKRRDVAKTALGAEEVMRWEHTDSIETTFRAYRKRGFAVVAVEQDPASLDYRTAPTAAKQLLIFGSEVGGLPRDVLDACDRIIEIPLYGTKESLNVAVAAGIVLFRLC